ncbi:hypothetical protein C8Q80DRAFT_1264947 [Daedaleopsis nitida]|nr:hypothetical protein C8Q80DRAFT_1264947 [Daedaleopsis nitida]
MRIEDIMSASVDSVIESSTAKAVQDPDGMDNTQCIGENDASLSGPPTATVTLYASAPHGGVDEENLDQLKLEVTVVQNHPTAAEQLYSSDEDEDEDFIPRGRGGPQTASGVHIPVPPLKGKDTNLRHTEPTAAVAKGDEGDEKKKKEKKKEEIKVPQSAQPVKRK